MKKYRVLYMRPDHFGRLIHGDVVPALGGLCETHTEVRVLEAAGLDEVYSDQQAHNWGKDWEATNALLESLELQHTIMSVGDVIQDVATGDHFAVAPIGFTNIGRDAHGAFRDRVATRLWFRRRAAGFSAAEIVRLWDLVQW